MKVVVLGLGYVGSTVAACLLKSGHTVVGIDISEAKVDKVRRGLSPIVEPDVGELLAAGRADGRLFSDTTPEPHLLTADLTFVCVGTPSENDGSLVLTHVQNAMRQVGTAIRHRAAARGPLICVVRSTIPPGTMERVAIPALMRAAGGAPADSFEIAFNPEFLREGTAVSDFFNPPKIVIGERFKGATHRLRGIYDGMEAPLFEVSFSVAEFIKLADNSFHALKVAFANEIGRLCLEAQVDPQKVMDIFVSDTKLNLSPYYLRPGGPFGGSCLPKDIRALAALGRQAGVRIPLLEATLPSNETHKAYLAQRVMTFVPPGSRILQLGLTFKTNTGDLRESPLVHLASTLLREGYDIRIYEPHLSLSDLTEEQRADINGKLPDLSNLLVTNPGDAKDLDLVIIGKDFSKILDRDAMAVHSNVPTLNLHRLAPFDDAGMTLGADRVALPSPLAMLAAASRSNR